MNKQVKEAVEIAILTFALVVLVGLVGVYPKIMIPAIIFNAVLALYLIYKHY